MGTLPCWIESTRTRRVINQTPTRRCCHRTLESRMGRTCPLWIQKDGQLRFWVDYRKLNTITIKDSYPLPRIDERIDALGETRIFFKVDAFNAYWQINIAESDRHKTSFGGHSGTFHYVHIPIRLKNAPAAFQCALDLILTRFKWKIVFQHIYRHDFLCTCYPVTVPQPAVLCLRRRFCILNRLDDVPNKQT